MPSQSTVLETRRTPEGYIRRRRKTTLPDGTEHVSWTVEVPEALLDRLRNSKIGQRIHTQVSNAEERRAQLAYLCKLFEQGHSRYKAALVAGLNWSVASRAYEKWQAGIPVKDWRIGGIQARKEKK